MFNHAQSSYFPGWFVGTCTNKTFGLTANLLLLVSAAGGRMIQGELGLSGDLAGGSAFNGTFDGEALSFTTCTPEFQTYIRWHGRLSKVEISGTYEVFCEDPKLVLDGVTQQQGIWSCTFVRSLGGVDPQRSEWIWVFNDGAVEGPMPQKQFLEQVGTGRWPDKAIVATEDCTIWATVFEVMNQKEAGDN